MLFDADHIPDHATFRQQLTTDPDIFFHFTSPSGDGEKFAVQLDTVVTDEGTYRATYVDISDHFKEKYGIKLDSTSDPARTCFFSYDPNLHVNYESTRMGITEGDDFPLVITEKEERVAKPSKRDKILLTTKGVGVGDRHAALISQVGLYIKQGMDEDFTIEAMQGWNLRNTTPHTEEDIVKKVKSAFKSYKHQAPVAAGNGSKDPKVLIESAENFLNTNYDFRKNTILGRVEMKDVQEDNFYLMEDYDLNSIHVNMLKENVAIGHDMLKRFLDSEFVRKYDPFIEYFEGLHVWDGTTDYIGQLASSVHLMDTSEVQPFANNLMRWCIGYVATAIQPDAVNQAAIVFSGAQGIQKTRWFDRLVPAKLADYSFTGTINPESKDAKISLSECILINLDEMESMRKSDIGSLKSIMTLSKIRERRPYGSFSENMIRHASFVGSINATDFLDDPSGSRRFLTFEVKSFDFAAIPDIDMAMAQALSLYKAGERWWFEDHEIKQINERNMKHSVVGYEEELLLKHTRKTSTAGQWLTATEIAQAIKLNDEDFRVDNGSVKKIGYALTKHGYESKRPGGIKKYRVTTLGDRDQSSEEETEV